MPVNEPSKAVLTVINEQTIDFPMNIMEKEKHFPMICVSERSEQIDCSQDSSIGQCDCALIYERKPNGIVHFLSLFTDVVRKGTHFMG